MGYFLYLSEEKPPTANEAETPIAPAKIREPFEKYLMIQIADFMFSNYEVLVSVISNLRYHYHKVFGYASYNIIDLQQGSTFSYTQLDVHNKSSKFADLVNCC